MAFFLPKHSSAASARLTQDNDNDNNHHSPLKPPRSPNSHRRLESEAPSNWILEDECDHHQPLSDGPTKSTSFSSSDSDNSYDSEDDDDDYESGSSSGSINDGEHSLTSGGSAGSLTEMIGLEYDDGDLHTLNQLVNKLHAAELKRKKEQLVKQGIHDGGVDGISSSAAALTLEQIQCQSSIEEDLPSVLPPNLSPPHFSPLQSSHSLSISSVESWRGPSLEIVPTESLEEIMPVWKEEWNRDRKEWEDRRKVLESREVGLKRSRTAPMPGSIGLHHRNHSLPGTLHSSSKHSRGSPSRHHSNPHNSHSNPSQATHQRSLSVSSSTHRHFKYGKPPTLPNARNPNPMVSSSSKKIHKKHARYALTAGMMLGIRESVGGALGVEAELEIRNWEGWEERWREDLEDKDTTAAKDNDDAEKEEEEGLGPSAENGDWSGSSKDSARHRSTNSTSSSPARSSKSTSPSRPQITTRALSAYTTLTTECERITKYKFPPHQFYLGSNTSKPLPHKYKFKVYAPLVFARIRSLFGVEKQTFLHSICGKFNFYEFASNARSGQFFFYSHDGRYMIKTLTYTESKFLREILPHYYRHLTRYPSTFLTHFYGMYRVCMPNANNQRLHFIIMRSVFHTEKKIDRVWDLKGSKAGRKASVGDSVQKDLDILDEKRKLRFKDPKARGAFLEQLARDATFLARLGIMDYSLLLGLHDGEEKEDGNGAGAGSGGCGKDNSNEGGDGGTPKAGNGNAYQTPRENSQKTFFGKDEPERSNTPFRRGIMQRASSAGDTKVGNDGFKALEGDTTAEPAPHVGVSANNVGVSPPPSLLKAIPESPVPPPPVVKRKSSVPKNVITDREDSGIEGYGARLEDGTLSKQEIYFCGIIDILQYYNARKIGETVLRKAAGNSGQDISCVDPETYGKRFVKFISNLVEE